MGDIVKSLEKAVAELSLLSEDIKRMVMEKRKEEGNSDKKDFKDISLRSLQPTIKMYKTKDEAKTSKENKEFDFIKTQLEKIFS